MKGIIMDGFVHTEVKINGKLDQSRLMDPSYWPLYEPVVETDSDDEQPMDKTFIRIWDRANSRRWS